MGVLVGVGLVSMCCFCAMIDANASGQVWNTVQPVSHTTNHWHWHWRRRSSRERYEAPWVTRVRVVFAARERTVLGGCGVGEPRCIFLFVLILGCLFCRYVFSVPKSMQHMVGSFNRPLLSRVREEDVGFNSSNSLELGVTTVISEGESEESDDTDAANRAQRPSSLTLASSATPASDAGSGAASEATLRQSAQPAETGAGSSTKSGLSGASHAGDGSVMSGASSGAKKPASRRNRPVRSASRRHAKRKVVDKKSITKR